MTRKAQHLLLATCLAVTFIDSPAGAAAAPEVVKDCDTCPELVAVPSLSSKPPPPNRKLHIGRYEVTWREYLPSVRQAGCPVPMLANGKPVPITVAMAHDRLPVTGVDYHGVQCFLGWLSATTGRTYRLPSAAEWEHAARAGATSDYPWGNDLGQNNAFVTGHFDKKLYPWPLPPSDPRFLSALQIVGRLAPNAWGLFDVIGNAAELTEEARPGDAARCAKFGEGKPCLDHAIRGVGVGSPPTLRSRLWVADYYQNSLVGFRVVSD